MTDLEGTAIVLAASTEPGQVTATTTTLLPGATIGVANIQDLRNPLDVPILVEEILFNIISNSGGLSGCNLGGDIKLGLKLGSDEIVHYPTALWMLGPSKNFSVASGSSGPTALAAQLNSSILSMRLASELIIYPGEFLSPQFHNAAQLTSVNVAVRMIVRGRAMKADAKRQSLPWICGFDGGLHAPNANYTDESTELSLFNPYNVPLGLDRIVGGIANDGSGGATAGLYANPAAVDAGLNYCLARIVDGDGQPIVRDFTPLGHMCQLQDFSWKLKGSMPAASFWKMYIQDNYASIGAATPNLKAMVALIGHRPLQGSNAVGT